MTALPRQVKVRVPATSANLGAGFDAVGVALCHYDELVVTLCDDERDTSAHVEIVGEGEHTLPRDETNMVVAAFRKACATFGVPAMGVRMHATNRIPQARGLGSSAEAIVAGMSAAAAFAHPGELRRDAIFALAAQMEGHPDNVAPAVYGGLTVSWNQALPEGVGSIGVAGGGVLPGGFHTVRYPVSPTLTACVLVPDVELSTAKARAALPAKVPYADAVANVSRVALLPAAMGLTMQAAGVFAGASADAPCDAPDERAMLERGNALLYAATQDWLHQPYRSALMASSWRVIETLREHGYAAMVSGAGPCVLVLHHGDAYADMQAVVREELASERWRILPMDIDHQGVQVERV